MNNQNGYAKFRIKAFHYCALLLWIIFFISSYIISKANYLLFHVSTELLSVVVAVGIFMFAWNTSQYITNSYYKVIGISFLFIGCLDFIHTIAYKGMLILPQISAPEATQLWIAARYLQAISFLIAPFFLDKVINIFNIRLLFSLYGAITIFLLLSIFYWDIFPVCYITGTGLTKFKIISEYIISFMFACSILLLFKHRAKFDQRIMKLIIISLLITILSELAFTNYLSVYDEFNVLGHTLKLIAVYFIYRAIIEKGLRKPYNILLRDLQEHQEEQQRLLNELSDRNSELIQANQELDTFMHITTHDLQSPLQSFSGFLEMLKNSAGKKLNEEEHFFLQRLTCSVNHMQDIIENLLTLSKMSHAKNTFENLDINKLCSSLADQLSLEIQNNNVELQIAEDLPCIITDRLKIREVILNLFTNAIKFSSKIEGRTPRVEIGYRQEQHKHVIFVKDNGIGIEDQYQQQIFDCFNRLHSQNEYKGTGIGLYIVKVLVEKLGGEVRLESQYGKGSTFFIVLPMSPPNE